MYRTYTGTRPPPAYPWGMQGSQPGHCRGCGQPSGQCCCGCRECRKESKELVVTPVARGDNQDTGVAGTVGRSALGSLAMATLFQSAKLHQAAPAEASANFETSATTTAAAAAAIGQGEAFIGGGCCVSLSVEYTPSSPTVTASIAVLVRDAEGTVMAWMRTEQPGAGYKVKEGIIATNPGATLAVVVSNATARVRWCEIFSC